MQAGHGGLRPRRAMLALAVVGCAVLFGAGSPAHAGGGATTTLPNDVVHNLGSATLLGPVSPSQPVTVGVFLANPNQAAEDAYLKDLYDPSSPSFGSYLDPDSFNTRFGVPSATYAAAQSWLQGAGLSVTSTESARNYLLATGTAAQVQSAFSTTLNRYSTSGVAFYANTVAPAVPAGLGVDTVLGLNNLHRFQTATRTTTAAPTGKARTRGCSARRTSGRSTTSLRRTWATARRWASSAGASRTAWSPTCGTSRPSGGAKSR